MTKSMNRAIDENQPPPCHSGRLQRGNDITPQSIMKPIDMSLVAIVEADTLPCHRAG